MVKAAADRVNCVVDRNVLNANTYPDFSNIGLAVFAPLCGKNRGAFVTNPPDGRTYGCVSFPGSFGEKVGVSSDIIVDSNSIQKKYDDGNITASDAVELVDLFVQSVYFSSPLVEEDYMACAVGGIAKLDCPKQSLSEVDTIRAVTLAGVFVPATWATSGSILTSEQSESFYSQSDFEDMKALGLNTVHIPISAKMFEKDSSKELDMLEDLLGFATDAGLLAIIDIQGEDQHHEHFAIEKAAKYADNAKNVIALSLPAHSFVESARQGAKHLPLMIPTTGPKLSSLVDTVSHLKDDPNIFVALDWEQTSTVADVASSTLLDDRLKMFYHESIACDGRSPIEYASCYQGMSAFVSKGFDLSIDNCLHKEEPGFFDFGQCGRLNETAGSNWWQRHRQSLLARQMASFETGLGWTYPAWKLYNPEATDVDMSVLDTPAKLRSLKHVAAAGLFPSLGDNKATLSACLNPPVADFVLGDDTMSPTPGPPPACDGGWWDPDLGKCAYWIPPPPTVAPTPCVSFVEKECEPCDDTPVPCPTISSSDDEDRDLVMNSHSPIQAAFGGSVATMIIGAVIFKFVYRHNKGHGYTQVPDIIV
eukprot:scaffold421244_cov58-Attheya_sp.AAC.4